MAKLEDVARLAEVSIATVSRVINEPELVRDETREKVQHAIRTLRYHPSRVARRLRVESGGANLIGLIIPDIQNPFFADVARGVEDVAQQHGYTVFLGNSDEDAHKERRYLDVMRAESVDGIIVPPISENDQAMAELAGTGLPMVCVDRRLARVRVDTVIVDNVRGAYEAVDHLVRLGRRRIGFI
jgi:DNA-binding LacI/PurR family transcriptional regulator